MKKIKLWQIAAIVTLLAVIAYAGLIQEPIYRTVGKTIEGNKRVMLIDEVVTVDVWTSSSTLIVNTTNFLIDVTVPDGYSWEMTGIASGKVE